jgi:hypothetical protein
MEVLPDVWLKSLFLLLRRIFFPTLKTFFPLDLKSSGLLQTRREEMEEED